MDKFAILEEIEGIEEFCKQYLRKQGYTISRPETKVEVNTYLKTSKLSKEAFDKIEETDNTPLSLEDKLVCDELRQKRISNLYGSIKDKGWIHEKCNTNTPPTSVPEHPSKGNKKKTLPDKEALEINNFSQSVLRHMIRETLKEAVQKDKFEDLDKINIETIYWDIYCEKETISEMRKKIEEIYPHFKEQHAKSIKQHNEDNRHIKRKEKYKDILNLIGFNNKLTSLTATSPLSRDDTIQEIQKTINEFNDWLEEEV